MTIEDRIREAVDGYLTKVRQDLDAHVQHLTEEIVQLVMTEQQEWSAERDRVVAEALAEGARLVGQGQDAAAAVATALQGSRQSRVEALERLTSAVRSIDEAGSLTGILGALLRGTAAETSAWRSFWWMATCFAPGSTWDSKKARAPPRCRLAPPARWPRRSL